MDLGTLQKANGQCPVFLGVSYALYLGTFRPYGPHSPPSMALSVNALHGLLPSAPPSAFPQGEEGAPRMSPPSPSPAASSLLPYPSPELTPGPTAWSLAPLVAISAGG